MRHSQKERGCADLEIAAYAVHDVREVYWLATAGWAPLGPRGSRRLRARRALRRYWAVRQAGNYAPALWLTVSLIVVGDGYFIAFHDIYDNPDTYDVSPEMFSELIDLVANSGVTVRTVSDAATEVASQLVAP